MGQRRQPSQHQSGAQKFERPSPEQKSEPGSTDQSDQSPVLDVVRDEEKVAEGNLESSDEDSADPESAPSGGPGIGGSLPTPPPIPQRRAAIGAIQELSEDDVKFLEFAFVLDMPIQGNCRERIRSRMGQHPDFATRSTNQIL